MHFNNKLYLIIKAILSSRCGRNSNWATHILWSVSEANILISDLLKGLYSYNSFKKKVLLSKLLVCSDYARICYSGHFLSAYLDQSHNVYFFLLVYLGDLCQIYLSISRTEKLQVFDRMSLYACVCIHPLKTLRTFCCSVQFPYSWFLVVKGGESLITCDIGFHDSLGSPMPPTPFYWATTSWLIQRADIVEGFVKRYI